MAFSPIPRVCAASVYDLTADFMRARGITLLLLDLDNTIATYTEEVPSPAMRTWMKAMEDDGITLFLVSNNRTDRAGKFAASAGIPYINRAGKPSPKALVRAMAQMKKAPGETALVGDQVYTDVLAANSAGVLSIVVRPLDLKKPRFVLRFAVELPFRLLGGKESP